MERYRRPLDDRAHEDRPPEYYELMLLRDLWHRRRTLEQELQNLKRMGAKGKAARLQREAIAEQLAPINEVFGAQAMYADPVAARWDAELAAGRIPDFKSR